MNGSSCNGTVSGLVESIVTSINSRCIRYSASVLKEQRSYRLKASNLRRTIMANVVCLERKRNSFCLGLPKKAFIFEPDIIDYFRHKARKDSAVRQRVNDCNLSSDDIEEVVKALTYGNITLHMRGRTFFEEDVEDY